MLIAIASGISARAVLFSPLRRVEFMRFAPCCSLSRIADTAAEQQTCVRMTLIELKHYSTLMRM
jgi:hypothetical protein